MGEIIIVDDLAANRRIMRLLLEHRGHRVAEAETVDAFFSYLTGDGTPDLAIFDLHLGEDSGITLLRQLRADPVFHPLPVLFASAQPNREAVIGAAGLGVIGFLSKPIDSTRFQQAVQAALARRWTGVHFREISEVCFDNGMERGAYVELATWFFPALGKAVARHAAGGNAAGALPELVQAARTLGLLLLIEPLEQWRQAGDAAPPPAVLRRAPQIGRLFNSFVAIE